MEDRFLLTDSEKEELLTAITCYNGQSKAIDAPFVSSIARGLIDKMRPSVLPENGGPFIVSDSWASSFLRSNGFNFRAATSHRRVTASEEKNAGKNFLDDLQKHCTVKPELFNMDEFFCHLDEKNHRWTWIRAKKGKPIQIGSSRLGFTCSVLVSGDGKIHGAQFIWKGATNAVHAKVPELDNRILQDHRTSSHFQDATTFEKWVQWFQGNLKEIRMEIGEIHATALLIIDQAKQHGDVRKLLQDHNCSVVDIPAKMTHVFQPCDQYIIANIKKHSTTAWRNWIQMIYSITDSVLEASNKIFYTSSSSQ